MAIGIGFGGCIACNGARGPRLVFHHDGLTQLSLQMRLVPSGVNINNAARCVRCDELDGLGRPSLSASRKAAQAQTENPSKGKRFELWH
jgi:hypothetical protein